MPLTAAFGRQKQIELYEVGQRGLQIELQASQTLKKEKKKKLRPRENKELTTKGTGFSL